MNLNMMRGQRALVETCDACGRLYAVGEQEDEHDSGLCGPCLAGSGLRLTSLAAFVDAEREAGNGALFVGMELLQVAQ
jgi:hypothetical protein